MSIIPREPDPAQQGTPCNAVFSEISAIMTSNCQIRGIFIYQDSQIGGKMRPKHAESDDMFLVVSVIKHIVKNIRK